MIAPLAVEQLRVRAQAMASSGEWSTVCQLLSPEPATRGHADLLMLLAEGYLRTGQARQARAWLDDSLSSRTPLRDRAAQRRGFNLLGAAAFELGDLGDAQRAFERAIELARAAHDDLLVARATNNLGAIANTQGRRDDALVYYQLAVPAYQRLGSAHGLAECFHNMAITYRDAGQLARADEYERRAIEFARDAGSERLLALAQLGRAEVLMREGEPALARGGAALAASAFASLADPVREADAVRLVGEASLALGDLAGARSNLERALALTRHHGAAFNEAEALRALAECALAGNDVGTAHACAAAALGIFQRLHAVEECERLVARIASWPVRDRADSPGRDTPASQAT